MTDVDKEKTLCASVTGRDNIPKLGRKNSLGTDGQRHVLSNSKDTRSKDLAGLASLGQLGSRHWECVMAGGSRAAVEEAAQQQSGRRSRKHFGSRGTTANRTRTGKPESESVDRFRLSLA